MKSILAIDDTNFFLRMLDQVLGKEFNLKTCNDPLQGLVEMVKEPPDLVLLDVEMPRINGMQILEGMKNKNLNIPTFIITANRHWEDENKALEMGAERVIYKPFKPPELIEKINQVLEFKN